MTKAVHLDFETRSTVNLKASGAHRYAEDPSTSILCCRYQFDGGLMREWVPGTPLPDDLTIAAQDGETLFTAHNATFERAIWNNKVPGPRLRPAQMDCTMARAAAVSLPQGLFPLGKALKLDDQKDYEGHALMLKLCAPRTSEPLTWNEHPDDIRRLSAYCAQDVRTEAAAAARTPKLTGFERKVWELDQVINDRGVQLDVRLVKRALAVTEELLIRANRKITELTDGVVRKVTEAAKIVAWINAQGVPCESIAEAEQEDLLLGSLFLDRPRITDVIRLRAASAKAMKFKAMMAHVCRDGRVRGSVRYSATIQRRWAGAGVQMHNMKRVETDEDAADVALCLMVLDRGASIITVTDELEFLFESPLEVLSICARSMIIAAPGRKIVAGDYANIEGRINAWLSGHAAKLEAFRLYDAGLGPDLYKITAGDIIGIPPEDVSREQRQEQGKVPELACGYQGALGAFKRMGAKYGVRLPDHRILEIVRGWRAANGPIMESWGLLEQAAIDAVQNRGTVISILDGRISYVADAKYLYCRLPSGGTLYYPSPSVGWNKIAFDDGKVIHIRGAEHEKALLETRPELEITSRFSVSYWAQDGDRWRRNDLYGGMQCAHVVSGIARDVLCGAMLRAEARGYFLVLTIHDELLCEVPEGFGSAEELRDILLEEGEEPWLAGCPIDAKTWEGPRYIK